MNKVLVIAVKEFRDRLRSGWVLACILVWLGVISLTSVFGLIQIGHLGVQGYERTTVSLLNLAQYLVPLLGLLVGHDLVAREREDRTINLMLAAGATRTRIMLGKFLGGAFTVAVPLLVGFAVAGAIIGFAARDAAFRPFLKLGGSALVLGIAFCGLGLLISTISRSRVQALVFALLTWGTAVFAFDLVVFGVILSSKSVEAAREMDVVCDATHANAQADIHAAFDAMSPSETPHAQPASKSYAWVWFNPIDIFRLVNLPGGFAPAFPVSGALLASAAWIAGAVGAAAWRLNRVDL